jgi:hypothetical protein
VVCFEINRRGEILEGLPAPLRGEGWECPLGEGKWAPSLSEGGSARFFRGEPLWGLKGLILVREPTPSREALVLIRDLSGFRGSWSLSDEKSGEPVPWRTFGEETRTSPLRVRGGWVTLHAAGFFSHGSARKGGGGGPEVLVSVKEGASLLLHSSGFGKDSPDRKLLTWSGEKLELSPLP